MSKPLTKFFLISFFLCTFNYPAYSVTRKHGQIASISAGTATGLCLAAAILYCSFKLKCDNKIGIAAMAAGGISTTLLTYFLLMKILEKYTPEHVLRAVKNKLEDIKQDELANQVFINDDGLLRYLNTKFGNTFAREDSVAHLKSLSSQTNKILEELDKSQDDVKNCDLINVYQELKDTILLFDELIAVKIAQVTVAFVKTDINLSSNALTKHLNSLDGAQEIIYELVSKIPHKKIFDNAMTELKAQINKIKDLKNLIQIKKIQLTIQNSDDIIKPIEMDYFIGMEFETNDDLGNMIATKFDSPWYLVLAKKNFAIYTENLATISENLITVIKFIQENPGAGKSISNHELEFYNHLQEKIMFLNKKVDALVLMIVKNENYTNQLQAYEQNLLAKKQFDILENQRLLMEKHLDNDKKIEASINSLRLSQNSKFQEIKSHVDNLENKIKDYEWKMGSKINQPQSAIKQKSL